jgi:hypothetical protein
MRITLSCTGLLKRIPIYLLFFIFAGILFISFSLILVFAPIFPFLVQYSLILKIAYDILKIFILYSVPSIDRDYSISCPQFIDIYFLKINKNNFPVLNFL